MKAWFGSLSARALSSKKSIAALTGIGLGSPFYTPSSAGPSRSEAASLQVNPSMPGNGPLSTKSIPPPPAHVPHASPARTLAPSANQHSHFPYMSTTMADSNFSKAHSFYFNCRILCQIILPLQRKMLATMQFYFVHQKLGLIICINHD